MTDLTSALGAIGVGAILAGGIKYVGDYRARIHSVRAAAMLIAAEIEAHSLIERNANLRGNLGNRILSMENGEPFEWSKSAMPDLALDPFFEQQSCWVGYFPERIATELILYENYKFSIRLTFKNLSDGVNASIPGGTLHHLRTLVSVYDLANPIGQNLITDLRSFAVQYGRFSLSKFSAYLRAIF